MKSELTEQDLYKLQSELMPGQMIILKFTADWCGPCQAIKSLVEELVETLPQSIKFFEINIDESLELYAKFKSKKMVNGIPAILAFNYGVKEHPFIPDLSVLGGNKKNVKDFFEKCLEYVNN